MKRNQIPLMLLLTGFFFFSACLQFPLPDFEIAEEELVKNKCKDFQYADSVFYLKEQAFDYIEAPLNQLAGTYGSFPLGLDLDSTNGEINVTNSETGLRYRVFYTEDNSNDTCFRFVTISGVNYIDSVYVLDQMDTTALPIYNAKYSASLPCDDDDFDGEGDEEKLMDDDGCEFDDGHDDDDGDGFDDEPPSGNQLIPQGVSLKKKTGVFNLKKTVENGTFGVVPVNGTSKDFILYYRLDDASQKTLNKINIRMYYFSTLADIPDSLLLEMEEKQDLTYFQPKYAEPPALGNGSSLYLEKTKVTRPPYIVIVGKAVE